MTLHPKISQKHCPIKNPAFTTSVCAITETAGGHDFHNFGKNLGKLKYLSKVTLPPSLISLSSKPPYRECRLLRLLTARSMGVYVHESETVETRYFIKNLLPDTLKELCLHDPTHMVARDLKSDEFRKLHFKVGTSNCVFESVVAQMQQLSKLHKLQGRLKH